MYFQFNINLTKQTVEGKEPISIGLVETIKGKMKDKSHISSVFMLMQHTIENEALHDNEIILAFESLTEDPGEFILEATELIEKLGL